VIAVDVRAEALASARRHGATATVDATAGDPVEGVRAATGGAGADVVVEALGAAETVRQAVAMARPGGRAVAVGIAPAGTAAPIEITPLVRRAVALVGSFGARARTDMPRLLELVAGGAVDVERLVTRRYALDDVNEAYAALEAGAITGRAVVVMDPGTAPVGPAS
jgi:S-(hydroxymethyl)glutathione dehydrogenase/alcohol dehydrogenase